MEERKLEQLAEPLLFWYRENARDLPWRREVSPYRVWVSEIMLQQTRVEAVKPYFARFLEALPTIEDLAICPEEKLLKLWEGLGYYSRVRNMKEAAQRVVENYDGKLPEEYEALLSLKGIGSYTAGAIASIAFGLPCPAVDGNVLRVLARVGADERDIALPATKKAAEEEIREFFRHHPYVNPGEVNQALMELGALVCLPTGQPKCGVCPWNQQCRTQKEGSWQRIPVKKKAAQRRREERTVLLLSYEEKFLLQKRPDRGLLAGLYEFPNVSGYLEPEEVVLYLKELGMSPLYLERLPDARHIFSHVEWHMWGYRVRLDELAQLGEDFLFVEREEFRETYPVPSAFTAYKSFVLMGRPK